MHVIDINDPYHPKEVARWSTRPDQTGNALHDIDVQDGLAYLSYWNEGLVILDIGNGIKGGSPANPQLVSQFKYDLNELYRDVEASGGPGFIRGTHTAWRHGKYVFIADEVFPASGVKGAKDAASYRAYGSCRWWMSATWSTPVRGLVRAGVRRGAQRLGGGRHPLHGGVQRHSSAPSMSRGNCGGSRAQGREIVHVNTADMTGKVQNSAMTWGVVVRDGLAYVNDDNNGLWIIRMEPRRAPLTP